MIYKKKNKHKIHPKSQYKSTTISK